MQKIENQIPVFKIGTLVRFINDKVHDAIPEYYPAPGTLGIVVSTDMEVQWPFGSTSENDRWFCEVSDVEIVHEFTLEEIAQLENLFLRIINNDRKRNYQLGAEYSEIN